MSIPYPHIPVGGRLRYFLPQWEQITSDRELLKMVQGLEIDFWDIPTQNNPPPPLVFSDEETLATDHLIEQLLCKQAIVECQREPGDYCSTIFLRRKSNGSFRMILNLRNLNFFVEFLRFKMSTLSSILRLVTENCHMASIDLSDAYLSIFVSVAFQKLLVFQWRHRFFKFVCMPFRIVRGAA